MASPLEAAQSGQGRSAPAVKTSLARYNNASGPANHPARCAHAARAERSALEEPPERLERFLRPLLRQEVAAVERLPGDLARRLLPPARQHVEALLHQPPLA